MLREIEHDLLGARRQGSLPAARDVVRSRQAEALAVAYLLTGDRDKALGLADAAFLALLREFKRLDPDADPRTRVLIHLGRNFLYGEYAVIPSDRPAPIVDSAPQKYDVENQRERTLAALSRLDDRERTALLLSDMCGVDPGELNERNHDALTAPIETARQRLRQSLDVASGESLRPILVEAGFDGPKDDLWRWLEGPYAEIQRREKRRRQLLTFGVIGAVLVMMVVTIAPIFGPALINDNEADAAAEATPAVMEDDLVITSEPPVLPTSTPSPSLAPVGDVPGTFLAQTFQDQRSENPYSTLSVYQPGSNEFQPVLDDGEQLASFNSGSFLISPDGTQIVVVKQEQTETTWSYTAISFDSGSLERQWETEIGVFERGDEQTGSPVRMSAIITPERVYVAIANLLVPEGVSMFAFGRQDGSLQESGVIDTDPVPMDPNFRGHVFLFPQGESELLLGTTVFDWVETGSQSSLIYKVELPELTLSDKPNIVNNEAGQTFGLWGAAKTPTGDALYGLTYTTDGSDAQISFFDLDTAEITQLPLPFTRRGREPYVGTSSVLSPDGRTLYVLDQAGGSVAIVDLIERRVERYFPVDAGEFNALFGIDAGQFRFGWASALSPDGTRLFLAAEAGDSSQRNSPIEESGVWVIDLTQWRIVDFWPIEGQASQMYPIPHEQTVLVSSWFYTLEQNIQTLTRFDMADGSTTQTSVDVPSTEDSGSPALVSLAGLYRAQHGRSPSVDGVEQRGPVDFQTLPRIEASTTTDNTAAGVTTSVEVRILDPVSGEVLSSRNPNVRFDSDSTVTAILKNEDQQRQIIVLANVEDGVYRGSVTFETTGRWTIDVATTGRDGTMSISSGSGWVDVAPTFTGSDDRLYQFTIASYLEQPIVDDEITIRLNLVDIESGVPLPDGVRLETEQPTLEDPIDGMPERIDVALTLGPGDGLGAFRTALLYRISPGVYEGTTQLQEAGVWSAEIRFQPPGGRRITIPAGTIEVVGP